jgi:hypothetical protein
MPIIIDEIVISVEVTNQPAAGVVTPAPDVDTQQLIVQQCVERVLEILRTGEER